MGCRLLCGLPFAPKTHWKADWVRLMTPNSPFARMIHEIQQVKKHLQAWAQDAGLVIDEKGYCGDPAENLPWLSERTHLAFLEGDGNEFGRARGRAKIAALHSSSALAVNFFDYWSTRDSTPLARALELPSPLREIRFEGKFPTGVGSRSPNLDVLLQLEDQSIVAVESKFLETFSAKSGSISAKYLPPGDGLWASRGLAGVQGAVEAVIRGERFNLLDVPQLLKHLLGLACSHSKWRLLLLWYSPSESASALMEEEIERFRTLIGPDSDRFAAMSYQRLWRDLAPRLGEEHVRYRDYLNGRYFAGTAF